MYLLHITIRQVKEGDESNNYKLQLLHVLRALLVLTKLSSMNAYLLQPGQGGQGGQVWDMVIFTRTNSMGEVGERITPVILLIVACVWFF